MVATGIRKQRLRIDPFGWLGLDLAQTVLLPPLPIPTPKGYAELTLTIPPSTSLRNVSMFAQSIIGTTSDIKLTNVWPDRIE